jgi:Na+/proline symporter
MGKWFDVATATFAFAAAVFWFLSAYGKLPPMVMYWDAAPDSDPFYVAVKFSAHMNKWAAGLSGASALCMAIKIGVSSSLRACRVIGGGPLLSGPPPSFPGCDGPLPW